MCDCERHSRDMCAIPGGDGSGGHGGNLGLAMGALPYHVFCDCQPAIDAFNNRYSMSHPLLFAIRSLCFVAHRHNLTFRFRLVSPRRTRWQARRLGLAGSRRQGAEPAVRVAHAEHSRKARFRVARVAQFL